MLTHIHPCTDQLTSKAVPLFTGLCVLSYTLELPSAQSPFAHKRCYLLCRGVWHHVSRSYPAFFARTDSCVNPKPSSCLGVTLVHQVFAGCCQPLLGEGPSRRYLCGSFSACLDPYPGCSCGALARYFPQNYGLPGGMNRSALGKIHTIATSIWG